MAGGGPGSGNLPGGCWAEPPPPSLKKTLVLAPQFWEILCQEKKAACPRRRRGGH